MSSLTASSSTFSTPKSHAVTINRPWTIPMSGNSNSRLANAENNTEKYRPRSHIKCFGQSSQKRENSQRRSVHPILSYRVCNTLKSSISKIYYFFCTHHSPLHQGCHDNTHCDVTIKMPADFSLVNKFTNQRSSVSWLEWWMPKSNTFPKYFLKTYIFFFKYFFKKIYLFFYFFEGLSKTRNPPPRSAHALTVISKHTSVPMGAENMSTQSSFHSFPANGTIFLHKILICVLTGSSLVWLCWQIDGQSLL